MKANAGYIKTAKMAAILVLGFSLMACNNKKDDSSGAPAAGDPGAATRAASAATGEVAGSCGRAEVAMTNVTRNAICDFLEGSGLSCEQFGDIQTLKMSARIFLDPNNHMPIVQKTPGDPKSTSILSLTITDQYGPKEITLPLHQSTTNQATNGIVNLAFRDDMAELSMRGSFSGMDSAGNTTTTGRICFQNFKKTGGYRASTSGCESGFYSLGEFTTSSCKLFLR